MNSDLTRRELEVLALVVEGKRNKEIAETLCITVSVVETHIRHIFQKLDVSTRTQAAILAVSNGIIQPKNSGFHSRHDSELLI
jgi:DNA-binding NarL/FixJ family response regulator